LNLPASEVAPLPVLAGRHVQDRSRLGKRLEACRQYLLMIANQELPIELRQKIGASDVVQETFLEAQRDLPEVLGDNEEQLLIWLRRVLLNNIANVRRHYQQTDKRDMAREVSLDDRSGTGICARLPARDHTPSSMVAHDEETELLEQSLLKLPEHLRQVIVLRHRENHTFPEIGQLLGRSPAAVRKLWVRAIERLQKELSGLESPAAAHNVDESLRESALSHGVTEPRSRGSE
jgi:RNA polymerase sigma-70 factor (ECF subfamily)